MSNKQRGNKEAKKPKQSKAVTPPPVPAGPPQPPGFAAARHQRKR